MSGPYASDEETERVEDDVKAAIRKKATGVTATARSGPRKFGARK
jgi:hypothetical protein